MNFTSTLLYNDFSSHETFINITSRHFYLTRLSFVLLQLDNHHEAFLDLFYTLLKIPLHIFGCFRLFILPMLRHDHECGKFLYFI